MIVHLPEKKRQAVSDQQERRKKMEKDAKIYVAGHRGMVGSAIVRQLEKKGYTNIISYEE